MAAVDNIAVSSDMCFMSYNTTGWNAFKAEFISNILIAHHVHFCLIQEHWLLPENVLKISKYFKDYEVFSLPAYKSDLAITAGRASGGLAIMYHKSLGHQVSRVTVPDSRRVQGITVDTAGSKFLLINVYFPNDNRNLDNDELVVTLQDVADLLEEHGVGRSVFVIGDLNCDFARNTNFVQIVNDFVTENNFATAWSRFNCDFTYSQTREVNNRLTTYFSTIDHFILPSNELINCVHAAPFHSHTSLSNHVPILLKMKYKLSRPDEICEPTSNLRLPLWKKAKPDQIQQFKNDLDSRLSHINVPDAALCCRDVHCSSDQHRSDIDTVSLDLLSAISDSVMSNIPHSNPGKKNHNLPGWSSLVQPFKEDADFWDSVWRSAGKPQNTELHRVARFTKNKYHRSVNKVKKFENNIRQSKFLSNCLDGNVQDMLKDMKKLRDNSTKSTGSIDGIGNTKDIANHFRDLYSQIFNVHQDGEEVKGILEEINLNMRQSESEVVDKITPELIKQVIQTFSCNKNDPVFQFKSDALKEGIDSLCLPLCDLMRAFITHGYIPDIFLVCILLPIIKNKRASSLTSENYRMIASTSLLLKTFDGILLELCGPQLKPSPLQFGFQRGQSTTMATWTLSETVSYFTNRGSPVYLCLLDLTKAFDHIQFSRLFNLLKDRIPLILLRFIIFTYTHQQCSVMWQASRSSEFIISNGVRQGAIASPMFFNIYINDIFNILEEANLGCWIGDLFYGALGYADDIALLAPSREALQKMVYMCEQFFTKIGIKVSTNPIPAKSKTVCICFGCKYIPQPLVLYGNSLPFVTSHKHLGHLVHEDGTPKHDMLKRLTELTGKFHGLRQQVGRQDPVVLLTLVNIYLCSLYGSSLWDIALPSSERADITWNSIVRNAFEVPQNTHRYIVEFLNGGKHIRHTILKRFQNFHRQLLNCDKDIVHQLVRVQESDHRSVFGRNCSYIKSRLGVERVQDGDIDSLPVFSVPEGENWRLRHVADLVDVKRGLVHLGDFTIEETSNILNRLCTG